MQARVNCLNIYSNACFVIASNQPVKVISEISIKEQFAPDLIQK